MSGSLNIYPFQDTETTIRFGVQICLFLIGLFLTNKLIVQPCLRLYDERKKRTSGNQVVAQSKLKIAEELEHNYQESFQKALDNIKETHAAQIKATKQKAQEILGNAQQKSADYMSEVKENLARERELAASQIHLHVNNLVQEINSKFGIQS